MACACSLESVETLSTSTSLISRAFSYSKEREPFIKQRNGSQTIRDLGTRPALVRGLGKIIGARVWWVPSGGSSHSHTTQLQPR